MCVCVRVCWWTVIANKTALNEKKKKIMQDYRLQSGGRRTSKWDGRQMSKRGRSCIAWVQTFESTPSTELTIMNINVEISSTILSDIRQGLASGVKFRGICLFLVRYCDEWRPSGRVVCKVSPLPLGWVARCPDTYPTKTPRDINLINRGKLPEHSRRKD